jgi:hypothetical protein
VITRTNKGVVSSKVNGTTLSLASVAITQDGSIIVFLAHDPVAVTSVKWNSIDLTKVVEETNGTSVQGSIWALHDCNAATASVDVVFASAIDAKSLSVRELAGEPASAGGRLVISTDVAASDSGTGTSPSSGATATLAKEGAIALSMLGVEFTWGSGGTGAFTFSGQFTSTSGGAADSNIGVADYEQLQAETTTAVTFAVTGTTSGDWVALVAVFYEAEQVQVCQEYRSYNYTQDRTEIAQQYRTYQYTQDRLEIQQEYRTWWFVEPPNPDPNGEFLLTIDAVWRNLEYRYFGAPQSPVDIDPRVMILDALTLLPIIEIEGYLDLHYVKSWTDMDTWELKLLGSTPDGQSLVELGIVPSADDFIIQVLINNVFDFAGLIELTEIEIADGKDVFVLRGNGVDKILASKLAIPPAGSETDSYEDTAENVIRAIVDVNLINPQATDVDGLNELQRTVELLDQTPNLNRGAVVKVEARNQPVFDAVREAALQDGELGFQILIIAGQLMFDVFEGTDRSAYVVFTLNRDNLKKLVIRYDKSNYNNWLVMAGAGDGALRALAAATTIEAPQGIKRKERFQDARELTTSALLQQRGKAILATEGDFLSIFGDRMPVSYPQYKIDFDLGDLITFSAPEYGLSVVKRVTECSVSISQGRPLEVELSLGRAKQRTENLILRNSLQATSRS